MSECEQEAKDKSASDTPRESPAETMPELSVQPSFTYNDEDSNSDGPAARFVMEPTEINDSFAAKFQCSYSQPQWFRITAACGAPVLQAGAKVTCHSICTILNVK